MARYEITDVALVGGANLRPARRASVRVSDRATNADTVVYANDTGPSTLANPLTTDGEGRIEGWVDPGVYNLTVVSGGRTYVQPYATPGTGPRGDAGPPGLPGGTDLGYFNVKDFGALGNGVHDDTTAIQAAMDATVAAFAHTPNVQTDGRGGTVFFPPGNYIVSSTLNMDSVYWGVNLLGCGGATTYYWGGAASQLTYTAATGSLLSLRSGHSNVVRDLGFRATHASYNGDLVDGGSTGGDGNQMTWEHCSFKTDALTSRSGLRLDRSIISTIRRCGFIGAFNNLILGDTGYSIINTVQDCTFNGGHPDGWHIDAKSGSNEALAITNNTFEPRDNGCAGSIHATGGGFVYAMTLVNNWFGDISENRSDGLGHVYTEFRGGNFIGNRFAWGGTGAPAIHVHPSSIGGFFAGNLFETDDGIDFESDAANQGMVLGGGNAFFGSGVKVKNPPPSITVLDSPGAQIAGQVVLKGGGVGTVPDASTDDALIVGVGSSASPPTNHPSPVILSDMAVNAGTLVLQPGEGGQGRLFDGADSPGMKLSWSAAGLGFQGASPQAKPTVTGSRGSNAALASLLTALANYGLITNSTS